MGFMFAFPTAEHVGVDAEAGRGFADTFGLREFDGGEFVFGCVGFVFDHDCLHCEAVLVVYKILAVSLRKYLVWFDMVSDALFRGDQDIFLHMPEIQAPTSTHQVWMGLLSLKNNHSSHELWAIQSFNRPLVMPDS
jgi:hypothetical protein